MKKQGNQLKRYNLHTHDDSRVICVEEFDGEWIKYEDHITIINNFIQVYKKLIEELEIAKK